ncbi:MAG: hypothetical protein ACTTG9_01120 [Dialister pneumosintes]|nr:unknown [Dialister sp. CAG:588]
MTSWFRNEIEKGNLRYVDKTRADMLLQLGQQKTTASLQSAGLQLPLEGKKNGSSSKITILDETDLVKYKEKNSSYYQKGNKITFNKNGLGIYDVIQEKRAPNQNGLEVSKLLNNSNSDLASNGALSEITIQEMLTGIKDMDNTLIIKREIKSLLIIRVLGFLTSL